MKALIKILIFCVGLSLIQEGNSYEISSFFLSTSNNNYFNWLYTEQLKEKNGYYILDKRQDRYMYVKIKFDQIISTNDYIVWL